jgi:hypothetical protein
LALSRPESSETESRFQAPDLGTDASKNLRLQLTQFKNGSSQSDLSVALIIDVT